MLYDNDGNELGEEDTSPDTRMACLHIQMLAVLDTLEHLQEGEARLHPKWAGIADQYEEMTKMLHLAGMKEGGETR